MIRYLTLLSFNLLGLHLFAAELPFKVVLLDKETACIQARQVTDTFPVLLQAQLTNQIERLVLDLRFAKGEPPVPSASMFPAMKSPVIVLVNAETRGTAVELAAQLRTAGRAILIGGTNLTGSLVPDITIAVSSDDEKKYQANPYAWPEPVTASPTNQNWLPLIDRTSEADLVRRRARDGEDEPVAAPQARPAIPVIRDPALARAMDLLTALAVLRPGRG